MRSAASVPFLGILLGFALWALAGSNSYYVGSIFCMFYGLSVVSVQPYKKKFIAISDAFIAITLSVLSATAPKSANNYFYRNALIVFGILPMLLLVGFITFKLINTKNKVSVLFNKAWENLPCSNYLLNCGNNDQEEGYRVQQIEDLSDADRMLRPERYMQLGYNSIS